MMQAAPADEALARRGSVQSDNSDDLDTNYRALEIDAPPLDTASGPPMSLAQAADALGDSMQSVMSGGNSGDAAAEGGDPRSSVLSGFGSSGSGGTLLTDANARCVYVNDPAKNLAAGFCDNKVITAKYTKFNFLPRFFFGRLSQVRSPSCLFASIRPELRHS
jgi:hypothetical protein